MRAGTASGTIASSAKAGAPARASQAQVASGKSPMTRSAAQRTA